MKIRPHHLLFSYLILITSLAAQSIPSLVNYQGRVSDAAGNPLSGNVNITVEIHSHEINEAETYREDLGTVAVNNGIFAIQFGSETNFPTALAQAEAWLEVSVDGTALLPRQRLVAVPYAHAASTVRGPNLFEDPASGSVGVGTVSPSAKLEVSSDEQLSERLRLSGQEFFEAGHSSGNGVSILLGVNRAFNRQLWLAGSARLAVNDTNPVLRFMLPGSEPRIEAIATDGETALNLRLGGEGNVAVGTQSPVEKLDVNGAIKLANTSNPDPEAGTIRWTGSAFEGFNGTAWVPLGAPAPLVIPELVEVGNPNNADDTALNGSAPGDHSGAVPYTYSIGKYEVTNAEYVAFLNAVDPNGVNATALYNPSMGSDNSNGGITFTAGNADGQKFAVKPGFTSKPVVYVNFYDAMRYCNWLHNGAQVGGDTENGAYTLVPPVDPSNGAPANGVSVVRNAGAKFAVPTEDEWYKAAYHQPQADGGPADNYWLYPTPTGSLKGNDTDPPNSGPPQGTAPAANFNFDVGALTDVGAYTTTEGFYGTFDMAGNVFEWIETRSGSSRVLRGGSWDSFEGNLRSGFPFALAPDGGDGSIGFRLSSP